MKKATGSILTICFVGVVLLSLYHLALGMDMMGAMPDCPFVSTHKETVCPMGVVEHINAWKSMFIAVVPTTLLLVLTLAALAVTVVWLPWFVTRCWQADTPCFRYLELRTYTYPRRQFQELFSNGILHPKLF